MIFGKPRPRSVWLVSPNFSTIQITYRMCTIGPWSVQPWSMLVRWTRRQIPAIFQLLEARALILEFRSNVFPWHSLMILMTERRRFLRRTGLQHSCCSRDRSGLCQQFNNAFVFDDVRSIVNQADALSGPLVDLLSGDPRPAVTLSLWLNYQWGELSVWGYHLFNVLLHALCVLVLWRVLALAVFDAGAVRKAKALRLPRHCSGPFIRFIPNLSPTSSSVRKSWLRCASLVSCGA